MTAPPPGDGRNQVVDLSVIDTDWGNAVADRTIQSYASPATRDALWPTPRNGSQSYTEDTDEFWVYRGGKWVRTAEGFVGFKYGPPATLNCPGTGYTILLDYDFPVKVNRHYLICVHGHGQLQVASSTVGLLVGDDQGSSNWAGFWDIAGQNYSLIGHMTFIYTPTSTKTARIEMSSHVWTPGAKMVYGANSCFIQVTDVGGA